MNPMQKRAIGVKGETQAIQYLQKNGYLVRERNYKNKIGEIDIIAIDGDYTCFIEVKKRETKVFGLPREAVTYQKQQKIRKTATYYMLKNKLFDSPVRFDVIDILGDDITLIKNAF